MTLAAPSTDTSHDIPTDSAPLAELRRQTDVLAEQAYPGLTETALRSAVAPLTDLVPDERFVLVLSRSLLSAQDAIERVTYQGRTGFTSMEVGDLERFRPTPDLDIPSADAYLLVDVDTGTETLGVRPDGALPGILAGGRTPLTLEEGLAVATQFPQWLKERNCFEMLGSRAGDKRVTGIWLSRKAPRLGWCWGGNPHTWLGMVTAASRIG